MIQTIIKLDKTEPELRSQLIQKIKEIQNQKTIRVDNFAKKYLLIY